AFCRIVNDVSENVIPLKSIIKSGRRVEDLGAKADQICAAALSKFSAEVPPPTNAEGKAIYGKQMNKLEDVVETYLHPILLQQLDLLRKRSIDEFRRNLSLKGGHAAVVEAESIFLRGAEECVRRSSGAWSYDDSLQELHSAMADIASRNEELWDVKLDAARQVQKSLQYLQLQQQQIQAVRQQVQGFISPWDISAAYRIPGTNINLSILYQQ
ncbi:sOrf534, partial [Symbiodinium microadriaticum]